ncbi:MAG TPA: glycosyltransferase N-terminal domain-containing protein, partial [Phenylobacterium sp.]|nr:glycosyltransferase N-terminal domain-containing protein [Phenylobacterium sp.]
VAHFLDHWRPDLGILVESELWPNLILAADRRGLPLALVSARMTQASADGWARARGAAKRLLSAFRLILPQEPETAARLAGLGATVGPELNLKQVGEPLPCDDAELDRLKAAFGEAPVILAASTHPGEEALIARAFRTAGRDARLVIAPRHPDRAEAICAELAAEGFTVARRSRGETPGAGVYLADTLGEMGLFFRQARACVMGGSFVAGIGGHNPLEPARLGVPIVTGPHVFNAQATYEAMFDEVAAIPAVDEAALARHIAGLIDYPHIARRIGQAALAHAGRQGQALNRALDLILPLVPA